MKAVFLNVDGVLNYAGCDATEPCGNVGVQDACVKKLKSVIEETNAVVVLCSAWWNEKWDRDPEEMSETGKYLVRKLKRCGIHISGKTENGCGRGAQIVEWIDRNAGDLLEGWCVLDDEVAPDYEDNGILPHLVKTCALSGLTIRDAEKAVEIIRNGVKNEK